MKEKLYDIVKNLLVKFPDLRNSDKLLIWYVWRYQGQTEGHHTYKETCITFSAFMGDAYHPESIRRVRQKIQEKFPELRSSKSVQAAKDKKEEMKGNFVYQE